MVSKINLATFIQFSLSILLIGMLAACADPVPPTSTPAIDSTSALTATTFPSPIPATDTPIVPTATMLPTPTLSPTESFVAFEQGVTYVLDRITLTTITTESDIEAIFGDPCYAGSDPPIGRYILTWYSIPVPDLQGNPESCSFEVRYEPSDRTVAESVIQVDQFSEPTIEDLLTLFGPPEIVLGHPCTTVMWDSCPWLLGYPSRGFDAGTGENRAGIPPGEPISNLAFFPPISTDEYKTLRSIYQEGVHEWEDVWLGE